MRTDLYFDRYDNRTSSTNDLRVLHKTDLRVLHKTDLAGFDGLRQRALDDGCVTLEIHVLEHVG